MDIHGIINMAKDKGLVSVARYLMDNVEDYERVMNAVVDALEKRATFLKIDVDTGDHKKLMVHCPLFDKDVHIEDVCYGCRYNPGTGRWEGKDGEYFQCNYIPGSSVNVWPATRTIQKPASKTGAINPFREIDYLAQKDEEENEGEEGIYSLSFISNGAELAFYSFCDEELAYQAFDLGREIVESWEEEGLDEGDGVFLYDVFSGNILDQYPDSRSNLSSSQKMEKKSREMNVEIRKNEEIPNAYDLYVDGQKVVEGETLTIVERIKNSLEGKVHYHNVPDEPEEVAENIKKDMDKKSQMEGLFNLKDLYYEIDNLKKEMIYLGNQYKEVDLNTYERLHAAYENLLNLEKSLGKVTNIQKTIKMAQVNNSDIEFLKKELHGAIEIAKNMEESLSVIPREEISIGKVRALQIYLYSMKSAIDSIEEKSENKKSQMEKSITKEAQSKNEVKNRLWKKWLRNMGDASERDIQEAREAFEEIWNEGERPGRGSGFMGGRPLSEDEMEVYEAASRFRRKARQKKKAESELEKIQQEELVKQVTLPDEEDLSRFDNMTPEELRKQQELYSELAKALLDEEAGETITLPDVLHTLEYIERLLGYTPPDLKNSETGTTIEEVPPEEVDALREKMKDDYDEDEVIAVASSFWKNGIPPSIVRKEEAEREASRLGFVKVGKMVKSAPDILERCVRKVMAENKGRKGFTKSNAYAICINSLRDKHPEVERWIQNKKKAGVFEVKDRNFLNLTIDELYRQRDKLNEAEFVVRSSMNINDEKSIVEGTRLINKISKERERINELINFQLDPSVFGKEPRKCEERLDRESLASIDHPIVEEFLSTESAQEEFDWETYLDVAPKLLVEQNEILRDWPALMAEAARQEILPKISTLPESRQQDIFVKFMERVEEERLGKTSSPKSMEDSRKKRASKSEIRKNRKKYMEIVNEKPPKGQKCEMCEEVGVNRPAVGHTKHPDYIEYWLCEDHKDDYDYKWEVYLRQSPPSGQECELCGNVGEHIPAVGHCENPDFSGYWLCENCIDWADSEPWGGASRFLRPWREDFERSSSRIREGNQVAKTSKEKNFKHSDSSAEKERKIGFEKTLRRKYCLGPWVEVEDFDALEKALQLARGPYQQSFLLGWENLSGSTLRGKAQQYGDIYQRSRWNLMKRCRAAGIPISERKGPHGKRILVIGEKEPVDALPLEEEIASGEYLENYSSSKTMKKKAKCRHMNEDNTFKGGFDGCVAHFMECEGLKKENAEKLCAYINRRKKTSGDIIARSSGQRKISGEKLYRILVDWEYNAEDWWDAARESKNIPKAFEPLLEVGGHDSIVVSEKEMKEILNWAKRLPGWGEGPSYARNPLLVQDYDESMTEYAQITGSGGQRLRLCTIENIDEDLEVVAISPGKVSYDAAPAFTSPREVIEYIRDAYGATDYELTWADWVHDYALKEGIDIY